MAWTYMAIAIVLEICGTTCMKLSDGMTKAGPTLAILPFYAGSFAVMALALKQLELGTAYAIWSGVGTALTGAIGVVWFGESVNAMKVGSIALIILGVVGLKLAQPGE